MYVIFPADEVVDESYFALVAQEQANPTGAAPAESNNNNTEDDDEEDRASAEDDNGNELEHDPSFLDNNKEITTTRVFHSTEKEQISAEQKIQEVNSRREVEFFEKQKVAAASSASLKAAGQIANPTRAAAADAPARGATTAKPVQLVQVEQTRAEFPQFPRAPHLSSPTSGTASATATSGGRKEVKFSTSDPPSAKMSSSGRDFFMSAASTGGGSAPFSTLRDLAHPALNDTLRQQQQNTFRLVKTGRITEQLQALIRVIAQRRLRGRPVDQP